MRSRPWLSFVALAFFVTSGVVACGDDDDGNAGKDGGADAAVSSSGGKAGKGGGGNGGSGGSKAGAGGKGGSGGSDNGGNGGSAGSDNGGSGGSDVVDDDAGSDTGMDAAVAECGNGVVEDGEDCDDDGHLGGDGCSAGCEFESGWTCSTDEPTVCTPFCGDGKLLGDENLAGHCDDQEASSPGCDATCMVEPGYSCTGEPSVCAPLCGNGALDGAEECDDGNDDAEDGCAACAIEDFWSCSGEPSACVAMIDADVLLSGNQLAALSTLDPASIHAPVALTGVAAGDALVAIDRSPLNGALYGLGYNSTNGTVQLYGIRPESGTCTAIGAAAISFVADDGSTPAPITGTQFGMDFSPTVNRVRVVDNSGQSFRINPSTGAPVDGDSGSGVHPGIQMDGPINGATTTVHECAFTNDRINQAVTTLYTLDQNSDSLYIQNPANAGTQGAGVPLSTAVDYVRGFDIPEGINVAASNTAATGSGYAVLRFAGDAQDSLARVDLGTGALSKVTPFADNVVSFALRQRQGLPPMIALAADGMTLLRFTTDTTTATSIAISNLTANERIVGIDFRPSNGQLYGLGINATADTGSLYLIDPQTGVAIAIGTAGQIAFVAPDGSTPVDLPDPANVGYGFDFNPAVDRIRVVTNNGLNFRIIPSTGAPIDGDGVTIGTQPDAALNGFSGGTGLCEVAYTNNDSAIAGVTTEYALDPTVNALYIVNPPNNGTVTNLTTITLDGNPLDFAGMAGFDIVGVDVATSNTVATGVGYAALSVGGATHLYAIDLGNGHALDIGAIGAGTTAVAGLAVGSR